MQEVIQTTETAAPAVDETLAAEMARVGVIYGHKRTKTHPKMREYIAANRNELELLKPEAIVESIGRAALYLKTLIAEKKTVLVIATTPAGRIAVQDFVNALRSPQVTGRWLGGTLTNFKVIHGRIKHYLALQAQKQEGGWEKYTKKERVKMEEELQKLKTKFEGLVALEKLPDAVLVIDAKEHQTAIREAHRMKIPVIALVDSDDNPRDVEYPIVANDHARASIVWVLCKVMEKAGGKTEQQETAPQETAPQGETV